MKSKAERDCYQLIQEIAVARDVYCVHPLCSSLATAGHHLFKRDRIATAFLPSAIFGVCNDHHVPWAHEEREEFKVFAIGRLGEEEYYRLYRLSITTTRGMDFKGKRNELIEILRKTRNKDFFSPK